VSLIVNVAVDTAHFTRSFERYVQVTQRSFVDSVNNKLFMIARKSSWFTTRAAARDITKTLGKVTYLRQKNLERQYRHTLRKGSTHTEAPLAALIINARKGEGKGLYGPAMREAVQKMVMARYVSIAYIASCWIPAIQTLAEVATIRAPNARDDKGAVQIGQVKGRAEVAKPGGDIFEGLIENEGWTKRDKKGAFEKYGAAGLQLAIDSEYRDNLDQIAKLMQPAADEFNRSQG